MPCQVCLLPVPSLTCFNGRVIDLNWHCSSLYRLATSIDSLPDDVLLEIFYFYRLDEVTTPSHLPWKWHRLAHVCQTWRNTIFSSSHYLNLELLCTHGTPVRKNLRYLPALPIVIRFPSYIKDSDNDNIVAALEHPDRVRVVELCAPFSVLGKMATVIQGPFPALTLLSLKSTEDGTTGTSTLSDRFLGGCAPRLQKLYLDGIPFPAALASLLSACNLVDLDLRDILDAGSVSFEAIAASLAALPRLNHLALGFRWEPSYLGPIRQPPFTRTVLPVLTRFSFYGFFEFLEHFVAQINAPQLDCLAIEYMEYWDEEEVADYQISQLCKFIDRLDKLKLSWFQRMDLHIQPNTVIIELVHEGQASLKLSIQDEGIIQVLRQLCGILSNVDHLFISSWDTECTELGDEILWLQLLRPFTAVKVLSVQNNLSHHVAFALKHVTRERAAEVLPALELLCLQNWPMADVEKFVATRQNVGRPVIFINQMRELQERLEIGVGG